MPKPYPTEPKDQFEFLVSQAETSLRSSSGSSERTIRQWRSRALDWLRENTSDSELADALLVVPTSSLQRGLAVLLRARNTVPFLRDQPSAGRPPKVNNVNKVFIVHGHDDALKNAVARLLSRLGLEPVILHEQANRGRTIIEKFLDHSDVGFAVVLLTPDDRGGVASISPDSFKFRARQNVVMELGFFLGRLGRDRVAAIYDREVEMPSDYSGVLFLPYDDNGVWQFALAKEIRSAGLKVDLNEL